MLEIVSLFFFVLSLVLGYTTYNMLKKVETYEDYIDLEIKKNETLLETLHKIDSKQMFEKDDEVGSLFEQLKQTIQRLKQFKNASEKTT